MLRLGRFRLPWPGTIFRHHGTIVCTTFITWPIAIFSLIRPAELHIGPDTGPSLQGVVPALGDQFHDAGDDVYHFG